jgi:hypothetical protein
VLLYASRSPWYRWPVGRSLMLSKVVIVAVLLNGIVGPDLAALPRRPRRRVRRAHRRLVPGRLCTSF